MLLYSGHIELSLVDFWQENWETPDKRLINIATIASAQPIPDKREHPPPGVAMCQIHFTYTGGAYCFVSYEELCKLINDKTQELCGG